MGPLAGVKVVELAGIGPAPFCCMLLADMGAEVVRIDRPEAAPGGADPRKNPLNRNRRSVAVDLKHPQGMAAVKRLVAQADVLVEGFRPGVTERLGLGPEDCLRLNPRLVYGRMTGWGQEGPLAQVAGHDINFISVLGLLHAIGPKGGAPVPPLNLVGDFGGGALYLAFGITCALHERTRSGKGQVIDAAMVDGAASLMSSLFGAIARGDWRNARGDNGLDGGAPWYGVYEAKDGRYVSVGAVEPAFYGEFLKRIGLDEATVPDRRDRANWPRLREVIAAALRTKTRDEWAAVLEGTESCFSPVLDAWEAAEHPHLKARGVLTVFGDGVQPAPAPRLSRTPAELRRPPAAPGEHTAEVLADWGFSAEDIEALRACGAVRQGDTA